MRSRQLLGTRTKGQLEPSPVEDAITLTAGGFQARRLQQRSGLIDTQPIANPDSQSLSSLDTPDSPASSGSGARCRRLRKPVAALRQAYVDRGGGEIVLFQEEPIP
jgi:hypothetical protein